MFTATVPWVFGNLQKTKTIQLITFFTRHICFWTMFIVSWHRIGSGRGTTIADVVLFDFSNLPLLFGGAIYSLINQQYVPSMMAPVEPKTHLNTLMAAVYGRRLCLTTERTCSPFRYKARKSRKVQSRLRTAQSCRRRARS